MIRDFKANYKKILSLQQKIKQTSRKIDISFTQLYVYTFPEKNVK